jgi:ribosomal protein S18 acetylase RimI-like enzyme
MIIREAEIEDKPAIVTFQLNMALETESISLDKSILEQGVSKVIEDKTKGKYYVAEMNREVIASLLITYEWSDWRNKQVWWIQSVYVNKAFRNQGVYKTLYEHVKLIARNNPNVAGIRLYVDNSNELAQEVYRKIGMNGEHYKVFEWMK